MKKSVEITINIVFWLIVSFLLCIWWYQVKTGLDRIFDQHSHFKASDIPMYLKFLLLIVPGLLLNYFFFYRYLVGLLQKRRFVLLTVLALSGSIVSALVIIVSLAISGMGDGTKIGLAESWLFFTIFAFIVGIIGAAIKGFVLWRRSIAERNFLEKKHLASQTALLQLKAQLNPHFLFNSLNNIDVLIEANPATASGYLKKLSGILRYVLYETRGDITTLDKEIARIEDYIQLQRIRTDNPNYINFLVKGERLNQPIAPMIFLPFVENAFKHTKNKTITNAIDILFDVKDNHVKMLCKNYYEDNRVEILPNEGLGIETIKQRLELLYAGKHHLSIDKTDHWFTITLDIDLQSDH